jgi:hypothetical protein
LIYLILISVLASPYIYDQNGVRFEMEQPADWVVDASNEESLVSFSQRDGLASLAVSVYEDLMWSDALEVFSEGTREFLNLGYRLAGKSRLTNNELTQAGANDGARFHFIKRDGEMKEHIFIMVVARENLVLLLTFYLPRWRDDRERLAAVHDIMTSFRFLPAQNSQVEVLPPVPPLR